MFSDNSIHLIFCIDDFFLLSSSIPRIVECRNLILSLGLDCLRFLVNDDIFEVFEICPPETFWFMLKFSPTSLSNVNLFACPALMAVRTELCGQCGQSWQVRPDHSHCFI